jgi:hypothetical protein
MPLYINGEVANISLAQLVAKGKEIIERENLPSSKFDPDLWAATVAVSRYDEAHRVWLEANEDEQMRAIRIEAPIARVLRRRLAARSCEALVASGPRVA